MLEQFTGSNHIASLLLILLTLWQQIYLSDPALFAGPHGVVMHIHYVTPALRMGQCSCCVSVTVCISMIQLLTCLREKLSVFQHCLANLLYSVAAWQV